MEPLISDTSATRAEPAHSAALAPPPRTTTATRPVYVYRVEVVEYPPRSHWSMPDWDPDWAPPGWEPELVGATREDPGELQTFTWPTRRHYFDQGAADDRAERLTSYGATVQIRRSLPVRWFA